MRAARSDSPRPRTRRSTPATTEFPDGFAQLVPFGWDEAYARDFAAFRQTGAVPARVVAEHRDRYVLVGEDGERAAVLAGRLRHQARGREELPATGDWVAVDAGSGTGAIRCAVRAAAESGALDRARLESWRRLRRELDWLELRQDEAAAAAERARVRTLHRAHRAHTPPQVRGMMRIRWRACPLKVLPNLNVANHTDSLGLLCTQGF